MIKHYIGARLRKLRIENELSQKDLAERMGVTHQAVSSWEKDRTTPNMGQVEALAVILHCNKSDIVGNPVDTQIGDELMKLIAAYSAADATTKEMVWRILR